MINVTDTHSLYWFLTGNTRLSVAAREALEDTETALVVPTIVVAEWTHLYARGRFTISPEDVFSFVEGRGNCTLYPFDAAVARLLPTQLEMHDGMIVATALLLAKSGQTVQLVTRDEAVTAANLVPAIW